MILLLLLLLLLYAMAAEPLTILNYYSDSTIDNSIHTIMISLSIILLLLLRIFIAIDVKIIMHYRTKNYKTIINFCFYTSYDLENSKYDVLIVNVILNVSFKVIIRLLLVATCFFLHIIAR